MKRQEFIRELTEAGCYLKRHGANHDIYEYRAATGRTTKKLNEGIKRLLLRTP